jgi:hypothetical protein
MRRGCSACGRGAGRGSGGRCGGSGYGAAQPYQQAIVGRLLNKVLIPR